MSSPRWFITGASNGFGLFLSLRALKAGHRVVGSVRSRAKSAEAVRQVESAGGTIIEMDMTESKDSITKKVREIGQIDYLVNNAGYSILGAVESFTEQEATLQMQTNFLGPLYIVQAALEGMRARKSGTIVNISSVAAKDPRPCCALYSASKGALEAFSESLAQEVGPLGISVLLVEPGAFRTKFVTGAIVSGVPMPDDYADGPVSAFLKAFEASNGNQQGDPDKGVERIFEAVTGEGMAGKLRGRVLRLVIGPDALGRMKKSNERFLSDITVGEEVALSTDFD
ncbi:hypothetical protein F4778DRAFT_686715 [Xylariomycetidae sp. FL2044]|nr:hypothetical protein F4778DRAFT_686715 [Xylariomycetidae sp. FL2044]